MVCFDSKIWREIEIPAAQQGFKATGQLDQVKVSQHHQTNSSHIPAQSPISTNCYQCNCKVSSSPNRWGWCRVAEPVCRHSGRWEPDCGGLVAEHHHGSNCLPRDEVWRIHDFIVISNQFHMMLHLKTLQYKMYIIDMWHSCLLTEDGWVEP